MTLAEAKPAAAQTARSLRLPVAAALIVVAAGGLHFRHASARYGRLLESAPLPKGTLENLPLELPGWTGTAFILDELLARATDTSDHVCRIYASTEGLPRASLFVGYGLNLRDLTPHRPEVCYVGQGWTQVRVDAAPLPLPDGQELPCQMFFFRQGDLKPVFKVVLHYYIADGARGPDVSWLIRTALRGDRGARYAARVLIDADVPEGPGGAEQSVESVRRLAIATAGPILDLMPREASLPSDHPGDAP